jgi:hypothetical protein
MFLHQLLYFLYVFSKPFDAWKVLCTRPNNKAIVHYRTIKNYPKQLTILAWPFDHTFHTSGLRFEFRQHFAKPRATENATNKLKRCTSK